MKNACRLVILAAFCAAGTGYGQSMKPCLAFLLEGDVVVQCGGEQGGDLGDLELPCKEPEQRL